MTAKAKNIPCRSCGTLFSEQDIKDRKLFRTRVCFDCYEAGKASTHREWCFGKTSRRNKVTKKITKYGYDPEAIECSVLCPHRHVCPLFITGEIYLIRERIVREGKIKR